MLAHKGTCTQPTHRRTCTYTHPDRQREKDRKRNFMWVDFERGRQRRGDEGMNKKADRTLK